MKTLRAIPPDSRLSKTMATIAVAIFVVLLTTLILIYLFKKKRKGSFKAANKSTVLICGPDNAGKTCLFINLTNINDKSANETEVFPSVECNEHEFKLYQTADDTAASLTLVDIPGSQKFASKFLELLPNTKLIIFVIDAADFRVAESGSLLFKNVLCNEHFLNEAIPLIVICNKVERNQRTVISNVKSLLQSEITNLARAHESELEGEDASCIQKLFAHSDSFSFDSHEVTFLTGSVLDKEFVMQIKDLIFYPVGKLTQCAFWAERTRAPYHSNLAGQ